MCSIAGCIGKRDITSMVKVQEHRAPDDQGVFTDGHITLGMGRLSIIDLASPGLCPYEEDHLVLSYNGEIYNYIELREELKRLGWRFRTTSDTEVLMKAWRQWGEKLFDKLNGMFAFALYNKRNKQLVLARDIAGEKPLYYYCKGKTFAFASEAKAFVGFLPISYKPLEFFDAFQHCHGDTLWQEVKELLPGHYLKYNLKDNSFSTKEYWNFKPRAIDRNHVEDELEELLADAVRIRTRSDVPYGLYFSGGVDSSIISTFHHFEHRFFFNDVENWKANFFKTIRSVVYHLDFPVGSLSSYPLWKLAERASKKVKVVLSGEGADEIFGGYVRYLPIAREWELQQKFPSYEYLFSKYFPTHLDGFAKITARGDHIDFVKEQLRPYFEKFEDPVNAMGFADFKLIMPSLLQMGDRMAGAFGIENRCPFLDRRVVEFGFSLPPDCKISGMDQKVILRRVLARRGLLEPLHKEKKGLTITFNKWFGKKDWDRGRYFELMKTEWLKNFGHESQRGRKNVT